jgi:hypothetical protein
LIAVIAIAAGLARSTALPIPLLLGVLLTSSVADLVGIPLRPRLRHVQQARAPDAR